MLKCVIFDCDGVMFDSKQANLEYYNHLLDHFGHPPMDSEEVDYVHMHNVNESVAHIFRHYPDQQLGDVHQYRLEIGYNSFLKFMTMETDLLDFLEKIQHRYHLAISTNRTNTMDLILKIFNLEQYFTKVMTSSNAARPKPAPDALLEILDHFNCTVEEAIYIGDSIIDQQHAQACDMKLIGFKNPALVADYHVDSFLEILDLQPFC